MRFVGRQSELESLERIYKTRKFQMPVIYGRRRIGKTSLIRKFIYDKPAIYFAGIESSAQENLTSLSKAIMRFRNSGSLNVSIDEILDSSLVYRSFDDALEYVFGLAEKERLILVIDEYPYLAESCPFFSSLLQGWIDRRKDSSKLFLILCGSSMSFMQNQVLGEKSPLYGRRTAQMKIEPFSIFDVRELHEDISSENLVCWYSVSGGVPLYSEKYDPDCTFKENLAENVLNPDCFLFGEPSAYLQQELRSPAKYNAIIQSIASGATKPNEIADQVGLGSDALQPYLKNLIELGVVERKLPVRDANKRKVIYKVKDNLFRFWYRFVPDYMNAIELGYADDVAELIEERHLSTFVGPSFEEVCRQWLTLGPGKSLCKGIIKNIGSWWGNDPEKHEQAEIDIVVEYDSGMLLLGECKWRNRQVDSDVIDTLVHRSRLLKADRRFLVVFSKSGFTDGCVSAAETENVKLVSLEDMGL